MERRYTHTRLHGVTSRNTVMQSLLSEPDSHLSYTVFGKNLLQPPFNWLYWFRQIPNEMLWITAATDMWDFWRSLLKALNSMRQPVGVTHPVNRLDERGCTFSIAGAASHPYDPFGKSMSLPGIQQISALKWPITCVCHNQFSSWYGVKNKTSNLLPCNKSFLRHPCIITKWRTTVPDCHGA